MNSGRGTAAVALYNSKLKATGQASSVSGSPSRHLKARSTTNKCGNVWDTSPHFLSGRPIRHLLARSTTEKASLISKKSTFVRPRPALCRACVCRVGGGDLVGWPSAGNVDCGGGQRGGAH